MKITNKRKYKKTHMQKHTQTYSQTKHTHTQKRYKWTKRVDNCKRQPSKVAYKHTHKNTQKKHIFKH